MYIILTCHISGHQPDFNSAILNSLKNLNVELAVDSSVKLDDFPTDLSFSQHDVPVNVCHSVVVRPRFIDDHLIKGRQFRTVPHWCSCRAYHTTSGRSI